MSRFAATLTMVACSPRRPARRSASDVAERRCMFHAQCPAFMRCPTGMPGAPFRRSSLDREGAFMRILRNRLLLGRALGSTLASAIFVGVLSLGETGRGTVLLAGVDT